MLRHVPVVKRPKERLAIMSGVQYDPSKLKDPARPVARLTDFALSLTSDVSPRYTHAIGATELP
jgi:hypothetical protein